jgi:hypothetical protein
MTISFTVTCSCCGKRSDELRIDYDMDEGSDDHFKEVQEQIIAATGEWVHVPGIVNKDVHVCTACTEEIAKTLAAERVER